MSEYDHISFGETTCCIENDDGNNVSTGENNCALSSNITLQNCQDTQPSSSFSIATIEDDKSTISNILQSTCENLNPPTSENSYSCLEIQEVEQKYKHGIENCPREGEDQKNSVTSDKLPETCLSGEVNKISVGSKEDWPGENACKQEVPNGNCDIMQKTPSPQIKESLVENRHREPISVDSVIECQNKETLIKDSSTHKENDSVQSNSDGRKGILVSSDSDESDSSSDSDSSSSSDEQSVLKQSKEKQSLAIQQHRTCSKVSTESSSTSSSSESSSDELSRLV